MAMEFAAAYTSLKNRVTTNWTHADVPIFWPNDHKPSFNELSGLTGSATPAMMHVEIRGGKQDPIAYGAPGSIRYRQSGEVIMRLFVTSQTGEATINSLCDDAVALLRGYRDGDLIIWSCAPASGEAAEEDGNFYQKDVIASWTNDSVG